jgi:hypothetical protein
MIDETELQEYENSSSDEVGNASENLINVEYRNWNEDSQEQSDYIAVDERFEIKPDLLKIGEVGF